MKIVVANLKMYLNSLESVNNFKSEMDSYKDRFIVAPSPIYLENFSRSGFIVSSQTVSDEDWGAYTSEISSKALMDLNVPYTMIGHFEIRKRYKEESKYIPSKVSKAIENGLKVILCVGEDSGEDVFDVIDNELDGIIPNDNLIISYEPNWAIGSDGISDLNKLEDVIKYIKNKGFKKVLYGGGVDEENIYLLNKVNNIDGFLVGSCALDASKFKKIIEVVK